MPGSGFQGKITPRHATRNLGVERDEFGFRSHRRAKNKIGFGPNL
jgi:hypothetical protein